MKTKKFYTVAELANLYKTAQKTQHEAWLAWADNANELTKKNWKDAQLKLKEVMKLFEKFDYWDKELVSDYINGMRQDKGNVKLSPMTRKQIKDDLIEQKYK